MFVRGEYAAAQTAYAECIALCRRAGFEMGLADLLWQWAWAAVRAGDLIQADHALNEAFEINRRIGNQDALVAVAVVATELAAAQHHWPEAAHLIGSLATVQQHIWVFNISEVEMLAEIKRVETETRQALGDTAFDAAHADGATWPLAQAIEQTPAHGP